MRPDLISKLRASKSRAAEWRRSERRRSSSASDDDGGGFQSAMREQLERKESHE